MGMASCHLRRQRMWRSRTTVLLDSRRNKGSSMTSPDLGATTAAVSARLSTQPLLDPEPELLVAYHRALWRSES
jgi:hypothetical protein